MKVVGDWHVTWAAAALGIGATAAHHISEGSMDPTLLGLAKSEAARGVAFGAGGGAAVALVTRSSIAELLGRTFVGGFLAAVAAPWIAEHIMHVPTSSTSYPVLCCSIGVLGYQIVHQAAQNPQNIPIVGRYLAPFTGAPQGAPPAPAGGNPVPSAGVPIQPLPGPPEPAQSPPVGHWTTSIEPAPKTPLRVPLVR